MKKRYIKILISYFFLVNSFSSAAEVPIGDLVKIATQRENLLTGYGLVVGLKQSGDSKSPLATEALQNILNYNGVFESAESFKGKNIAIVMVMGYLPSVTNSGDKMDIYISSIGDAQSLVGGYLLATPLKGADGEIYAVAQAPVAVTSDKKTSSRDSQKNTVFISSGAIVEKSVNQPVINVNGKILLSMINYDINTATNITAAINKLHPDQAKVTEGGLIEITTDIDSGTFLNEIFKIAVIVKTPSIVVIDPATGTIVMGENVKISTVAITKSDITIKVKGSASKEKEKVAGALLEENATVGDLVKTLNDLGLPVKDIIDVIKAIHAAGALHAELKIL